MTLTKNKMVREIGRRTRLKNRNIQAMLETLVEVWKEELIAGGRVELENFIVLEVITIDRGENPGILGSSRLQKAPQTIRRLTLRVSKDFRHSLKEK